MNFFGGQIQSQGDHWFSWPIIKDFLKKSKTNFTEIQRLFLGAGAKISRFSILYIPPGNCILLLST